MKKNAFIAVHAVGVLMLLAVSCTDPVNKKLVGNWRSKNGTGKLKITEKLFSIEEDDALAEEYFVKGDTILTSFHGNQPYTSYVVQKLDDHYLKLLGPDSVAMEFNR